MLSPRADPLAALALVRSLLLRDVELVGEEPLAQLLGCARRAVGATSARMDRSPRQLASPGVHRDDDGTVRVPGPDDGDGCAVLVLEGCPPGEITEIQSEVLLLCSSLIDSVVRATGRRARRLLRENRRDAVHAVAAAAVQHIDLDTMLLDAVEALRLGMRSQGVWIRAFDSPDPASLRRHSASYPAWAESLATEKLLDISGRAARICWERQSASILSLDHLDIEALTTEAERDFMFDFMRSIEARGMLMAPIGGAGECQGFIALTRTTVDETFDAEDEAAVMTIGRELGNAVAHARQFGRQRLLVDELKELHAYKDNFVATVAHQLKNPLTSILGHVELLTESMPPPAETGPGHVSQSLPVIQRGAERIRETVDALLTLNKVMLAHQTLICGVVPLRVLVAECAELVGVDARLRGVTIDLQLADGGAAAWGDRGEVETVVDNLLSNAVKYSRRGDTVTVSTYDDGEGVVLECRDEGLGMDAEDLERLFEAFYRSHNPRALAEPGTGLGMAIVKAVVDRHRGRIDVTSTPGVGTSFRVWLPSPPA